MATRYYICDVIGDGTDDNPYRADLQDAPGIDIEQGDVRDPWG